LGGLFGCLLAWLLVWLLVWLLAGLPVWGDRCHHRQSLPPQDREAFSFAEASLACNRRSLPPQGREAFSFAEASLACGESDFLIFALLLKRLPDGFRLPVDIQGGAPKNFGAYKRRCFAAPIIFPVVFREVVSNCLVTNKA